MRSQISGFILGLALAVAGSTMASSPAGATTLLSPALQLGEPAPSVTDSLRPAPRKVSDSEYFTFRLCNKSRVDIAVAVSRRMAPDDDRFMVSGWFIVNRGNCEDLGPYPKGWFYFYGEQHNSGKVFWGSDDIKLCVKYPGPFDRINAEDYSCKRGEKLKGFYSVEIGDDEDLYTFTMHN